MGLRETNKQERRRRVLNAARAVFNENGYELATTREIAIRARVGVGTVFVYAHDKRDLLMLIVNDDLEELTSRAYSRIAREGGFVDRIMPFFEERYRYWARDPELSAQALQETASARARNVESETERFHGRRQRVVGLLATLVGEEQHAGRLSRSDDATSIAWVLMSLYLAQVRIWLAEPEPNVEEGVSRLRRMFEIAMRGLAAAPAPSAPRKRRPIAAKTHA